MTTRIAPKISDAPGLVLKPRANGWHARWQARTDLVKRGYKFKGIGICDIGDEVTESHAVFIRDRCHALQAEMLEWGKGGGQRLESFDGTLSSLIRCYQTDKDSSFQSLRYRTKQSYESLCRRIELDHGIEHLDSLKARSFLRWHEDWGATGHVAMAHSLMRMLRNLFGFGFTMLEDDQCERLCAILSKMRFKMPPARSERLTAAQAIAIRALAHTMGFPSIALAQALQFELMLRQKDVIGEWVPQNEPGVSDVTLGNDKWLRGLRWSEIDRDLIVRHTTSKRQKDIEVDLKNAPMVIEELRYFLPDIPASGPMIVYEGTRVPYVAQQFRWMWRKVATAAGVPKTVYNMDSRAGAISEATDAGAELEHVRHAATHSDISMTQRYSRGSTEKIANVQQMRSAHRKKP
jgi:hypothetical protein